MLFDFTFFIPIPSALNPFTYARAFGPSTPALNPRNEYYWPMIPPTPSQSTRPTKWRNLPPRPIRHIPDGPCEPLARKRGWVSPETSPIHDKFTNMSRPMTELRSRYVDVTHGGLVREETLAGWSPSILSKMARPPHKNSEDRTICP